MTPGGAKGGDPLLVVVGARPNYVKVAPVLHALAVEQQPFEVVDTGQHYDHSLAGSFGELLRFPPMDHSLEVGSGTHAEQTGAVMLRIERLLEDRVYAGVLVPGDVNSTLAAALSAAKASVPVIHLEAGLRSGDWSMPEEVNRVVTDRLASLLLCHSDEAVETLGAEGVAAERVAMVGNTMIDSLLSLLPVARDRGELGGWGLEPGGYALVTLHRPALVNDPEQLGAVLDVLAELAGQLPVVLPVHPRTRAQLVASHDEALSRLIAVEPLDYLSFIAAQADARMVITDSGGVQEETSALGVPCITYRTTTERSVTISQGTNRLVGVDPNALRDACEEILATPTTAAPPEIPLWDGKAGPRAARAIVDWIGSYRTARWLSAPATSCHQAWASGSVARRI